MVLVVLLCALSPRTLAKKAWEDPKLRKSVVMIVKREWEEREGGEGGEGEVGRGREGEEDVPPVWVVRLFQKLEKQLELSDTFCGCRDPDFLLLAISDNSGSEGGKVGRWRGGGRRRGGKKEREREREGGVGWLFPLLSEHSESLFTFPSTCLCAVLCALVSRLVSPNFSPFGREGREEGVKGGFFSFFGVGNGREGGGGGGGTEGGDICVGVEDSLAIPGSPASSFSSSSSKSPFPTPSRTPPTSSSSSPLPPSLLLEELFRMMEGIEGDHQEEREKEQRGLIATQEILSFFFSALSKPDTSPWSLSLPPPSSSSSSSPPSPLLSSLSGGVEWKGSRIWAKIAFDLFLWHLLQRSPSPPPPFPLSSPSSSSSSSSSLSPLSGLCYLPHFKSPIVLRTIREGLRTLLKVETSLSDLKDLIRFFAEKVTQGITGSHAHEKRFGVVVLCEVLCDGGATMKSLFKDPQCFRIFSDVLRREVGDFGSDMVSRMTSSISLLREQWGLEKGGAGRGERMVDVGEEEGRGGERKVERIVEEEGVYGGGVVRGVVRLLYFCSCVSCGLYFFLFIFFSFFFCLTP